MKRGIILHGNCHMNAILEFLLTCKAFRQNYFAMKIPAIQSLNREEIEILLNCAYIWKNCDVLITQDIKDNNRFDRRLSFSALSSRLIENNKKAEIIVAPNLYFDVYFPTRNLKETVVSEDLIPRGIFPHNELILDKLAEKYEADEILKIVQDENLFSEQFVQWCLDTRINQMYTLEKSWDIKVMDYISSNYKKSLLFWSINHPANVVIEVISRNILAMLSCHPIEFDVQLRTMMELPRQLLYPSVCRWLRLEFIPPLYKDRLNLQYYTFEGYVRRYLKLCWNK